MSANTIPKLQTVRCSVCGGGRVHYAFSFRNARVLQCADCKFTARTEPAVLHSALKDAASALAARNGGIASIVAQIAPQASQSTTFRVADWQSDGNVELFGTDGIVVSVGQLDAFTNPLDSLKNLRNRLKPGEPIVFAYSDIRRAGTEVGSAIWERLTGERNAYIDTQTALTVLYRAGFSCHAARRLRRRVSLQHFLTQDASDLVYSKWRRRILYLIPQFLRRSIHVTSRSSDVAILATPRISDRPLVSVIVPVYNEAATVARVLNAILRVEFEGADTELVVVESNSTDGSREIVQSFANHPRVTCLFEDRPRGKGHATRLGLDRARGDIFIIQDADLEYDIEDYHSLVDPIICGHEAFVLGSRHGGRNHWKLRQFGKPLLSQFYNLAHVLVTAYINILFRLRLRDPQTMYKVCRRDCIHGIHFDGNYFNFDYELLLKIVRKGYIPTEVPVNYRSRSHAEGKKIRMWRDAPLGLLMITKLRLAPISRFLKIGERID